MNFASFKNALGQVVQSASSSARDFGATVTGTPKALREYSLHGQTATGGLNGCWKIFAAKAKKEGPALPVVSIWILDKRSMAEAGASPAEIEAAAETARRDASALARLKHPAVVKVVEALEETRSQLLLVTEPIFASAADLLARFQTLPPAAAQARENTKLSELEIKAGLLQVADGLHFLHTEANLVHRTLCPHTIFITAMGAWKLGGLSLTCPSFITADTAGVVPISYRDASMERFMRWQQPPLGYVAPELANADGQTAASSISTAADIFSLACFAYEALAGKPLLRVAFDLEEYNGKLASLHMAPMAGAPVSLRNTLQAMLAQSPSLRPPAISFAAAGYFQEDMLLRAVRFLDTMIQRDNLQKAAFLKDLGSIWPRVDARVLKFRMIPPLLAEARTEALQPVLLPLLLAMVEKQDDEDFAEVTFQHLAPVCASARGDALLLLTRHADIFAGRLPRDPCTRVLLPLLARAADQGEPRCQEEMLKRVPKVSECSDLSVVETDIVPRINQLCLATTNAGVRVAALSAMAALAPRLPKDHALRSLSTISKVTAVDRSPGTVSGCLVLGGALAHQWGAELAAEKVLPVLTPLLTSPSLSPGHFAAAMQTVKQLLDTVEQARAGDFAESQPARPQPSLSAAPSSSASLEAPRKQMPVETSSSVQPMRPSQAMASGKPGSASLGSISMSNGSGGIPAWMGAPPAPGGGSASGATYSQPGRNTLSSSSMASAGASSGQSRDFSGLGNGSGFGGGSASVLPQGLAASIGMNSSSSMSDPLGWMGPSDARNTGVPAAKEVDLFKDPGWQDPVLNTFGGAPALPSTTFQQPMGSMGSATPSNLGAGLDDFFGAPPSRPAGALGGGPLPPRLAPPPPGSHAVQFSPKKPPVQLPLGRQPSQASQQDSLI
ncbi:g7994 [Coccomyxa viridis]|uniref:G7994 protein n=1 Tax=Coccomyxa viridis TaxID=1274662 RepID=A0ABP1G3C9_9CHLO